MEVKNDNPMLTWAEREIALACESERQAVKNAEDAEYGVMCYRSALNAYKSLLDDNHSGFSIQLTKSILNRLIDGKCLTPIEDIPDVWNEVSKGNYQCKRMSSFFKNVDENGTITYRDIDRTQVINIENTGVAYYNGLASRLVDKIFPIKMPYLPLSKKFKVFTEEFLFDPKGGDYDTVAYLYILTPNDTKVELNRYFKEASDGKMVPIEKAEYDERKAKRVEALKKEASSPINSSNDNVKSEVLYQK